MHNLPVWKKLYYHFLGYVYLFAFSTTRHRWFGAQISSWVKFITLVLPVAAWVGRWGTVALVGTLLLAVGVRLVYWAARRAGYTRFVDDGTPVMQLQPPLTPIPAYQRVKVLATGLFSVHDREEYLFLRPAEYWQVPLGEHVVMAEQFPKRYLYQFFNANSLQQVQSGWLIFGTHLLRTVAITFGATWGPEFAEDNDSWIQKNTNGSQPANVKRTIYFTIEQAAEETAVLHTIVQDARQARLMKQTEKL